MYAGTGTGLGFVNQARDTGNAKVGTGLASMYNMS
jgi:hypothetical protein